MTTRPAPSGRPQPLQVGRVGQVVEDQCPSALGARQPGHEAACGSVRVRVRIARADRASRLREPAMTASLVLAVTQTRTSTARALHRAGRIPPPAASCRCRPGRPGPPRSPRRGSAPRPGLGTGRRQAGAGFRPLEIRIGERRDDPGHQRPGGRRRLRTLRDHADTHSCRTRRPTGEPWLGRGQVLQALAAGRSGLAGRPGTTWALVLRARSLRAAIPHAQRNHVPKPHASGRCRVWPCFAKSSG